MTIGELNFDTCEARGDLVSWETLNEQGSEPRTVFRNPTCNGKMLFFFESFLSKVKTKYEAPIWINTRNLCSLVNLPNISDLINYVNKETRSQGVNF